MSKSFKMLFAGDVVLPNIPGRTLFSSAFQQAMDSHVIKSCNFEAPVSGFGSPIKKAGPHLSQHPTSPEFLESAGFNVFNLANNHMYDYGKEALAATISSFKRSLTVGAGISFKEAYELKTLKVDGTSIGFLSFCEAEFGAFCYKEQDGNGGYAWINHDSVDSIISESRKAVDVLVVQAHGGTEDIDVPLPEWRARYRNLIKLGADAVIASHPHVPQGWETYEDKPIFYSLGNFCFDIPSSASYWNEGLVASIEVNSKRISGFDVIPISYKNHQIAINSDERFITHLSTINEKLLEPGYTTLINRIVHELWETRYKIYYQNALNSIYPEISIMQIAKYVVKRLVNSKKNSLHVELLLHNIKIESHRWAVERYLTLYQKP